MSEKILITNNSEETKNLGEKFARPHLARLKGSVIALYGDLGSGKTTFVQGMAKGLGIKRRIISPTFIIVRAYKLETRSFYHIDLYRIDSKKDIKELGIEEIINDHNNIVIIEWAEKMGDLLPKKRWEVKFDYLDKDRRKIWIKK